MGSISFKMTKVQIFNRICLVFVEKNKTNYGSLISLIDKAPSQKLRRPNLTARFGRIWLDLVGFSRIRSDLV